MKVIRRFIQEPVRRATRDSRLDAVPVGKVLVLGTAWTGSLAPLVDSYLESLTALVTPFSAGHILHAELTPEVLNMGKVWAGEMRDRIRDGVITSTSGINPEPNAGFVNASEIVRESERLSEIMSAPSPTMTDVQASLRRLRRAADAITRTFPAQTRDSRPRGVTGYGRPIGDGSKPVTPTQVNEAAAKFWRERSGAQTADAPKLAARMTPAEINEANRKFWAAR